MIPELTGWKHLRSGKVRDLFTNDKDELLIVASDRISAFDYILPTPIPPKNIPIQTKTKVNPAINNKVAIKAFDFLLDLLAFNPNPVIKER